jgi:hypothetical protein
LTISDDLLLEIARCRICLRCKKGQEPPTHRCQRVVGVQSGVPLEKHHVPEPWSGHLASAPILFVSSNPSLNPGEDYPQWRWTKAEIADFFENRFGGGRKEWVTDGARSLLADGTRSGSVPFWAGVRNRAGDLLGRPALPGVDYALVEVVRCKSTKEQGVSEARETCSDLYLRRTVEASGATVVVTLGEKARPTVESIFGGPPRAGTFGPTTVGGRDRYFASLGHPTSGEPKRWENCIGLQAMLDLREAIEPAAPSEARRGLGGEPKA